jgi:uncharacterized caspase-like protein
MSYRARRMLATVALAATAGTLWSGTAAAENRMALIIGNSAYETVTALPNPANDAKAMAELLTAAGFEVISAPNLAQSEMRQAISNFAGIVAGKGPDTVALLFYAGHGLQVDGENFLVPIDARIQREADVPLQAMRLADVMNTLAAVPSKTRIVILDACRNNPFSDINKSTGRGLAIVDAPTGSLVSYSTAPGTEAQDGDGANSPFTAALLKIGREPGVPIEQALKRVRYLVHDATKQQQTPWESSSLTADFFFFPGAPGASTKVASAGSDAAGAGARGTASRSVDSWRNEFRSRQAADAYRIVIEEGTPEAFEAYVTVYSASPYAPRVRSLLERRREMIAWYNAVTVNTAASFQTFLAAYPGSDLGATAQRLIERARSRSLSSLASVTPTCPCALPAAPTREKKAKSTKKEKQASRTEEKIKSTKKEKQASRTEVKPTKPTKPTKRTKRAKQFVSDDEIGDEPPPRRLGVAPGGPPVSIGVGIGRVPIGRPTGGYPGTWPGRPGGYPASVPGRPIGGQLHRF